MLVVRDSSNNSYFRCNSTQVVRTSIKQSHNMVQVNRYTTSETVVVDTLYRDRLNTTHTNLYAKVLIFCDVQYWWLESNHALVPALCMGR